MPRRGVPVRQPTYNSTNNKRYKRLDQKINDRLLDGDWGDDKWLPGSGRKCFRGIPKNIYPERSRRKKTSFDDDDDDDDRYLYWEPASGGYSYTAYRSPENGQSNPHSADGKALPSYGAYTAHGKLGKEVPATSDKVKENHHGGKHYLT